MMTPSTKSAPPMLRTARVSNVARSIAASQLCDRRPQCLLIVCGAPENLWRLLAALNFVEAELIRVVSPEETAGACRRGYDLVIVDVEPEYVADVLKTVRESAELANSPVLVERSRLDAAPELAGVLPRYRAMPCGFADLLKLARWYLLPLASPRLGAGWLL